MAGTPLGTTTYVDSILAEAVAGIREKAELISSVAETQLNTSQALFSTATLGLASMFNHLLRSVPPDATRRFAREVDATAVDCARKVLKLSHITPGTDQHGDMQTRLFLPKGGMGMQSCVAVADAAYIGHWGLVGPTVQKMLPHVSLVSPEVLQLSPLVALQGAAQRVSTAATASAIKLAVGDLPRLLTNSQRGIQGDIAKHLVGLAEERYLQQMPTATAADKACKRAFISGSSTEAAAAIHASRRSRSNRLTDHEYCINAAARLGMPAFPEPPGPITCPDCHRVCETDLTLHGLACPGVEAQAKRTTAHTAMDVAARGVLRDDPDLVVTGSRDAYPADHGFAPREPRFWNHKADVCVSDRVSGDRHLIDFTFTCAAKATGTNGAEPGGHADEMEREKLAQYDDQFPSFGPTSTPALVILTMERHGSWSKGTKAYWEARAQTEYDRQRTTTEFPTPLSVIVRRVRQTLAVALWRLNALHIAQLYRRALHGAQQVD